MGLGTRTRQVTLAFRNVRYHTEQMLHQLIQRARRRFLTNEIFAQIALALSVVMAGAILLLLLGTQLLDWRLLLVISVLSFGLGVYRVCRRIPSPYRISQLVDRRLGLFDSLSTALYFDGPGCAGRGSESMRIAQHAAAERLIATIDLERAVPFRVPRALYAVGALGLVASSLFALRYGLDRRLDLRAPIARIIMDSLGVTPTEDAALRRKNKLLARNFEPPKPAGLSIPGEEAKDPSQLDAAPDSVLDTVGVPDVNGSASSPGNNGKAKSQSPGSEKGEGESGENESPEASDQSGDSAQNGQTGDRQGDQQGPASGGKQTGGNAGENSSLMSKLRDAMSNLLSKMRQQPNGGGSQRQSPVGQSASQAKNQQSGPGQKGASGQQGQGQGQQSSDSDDGQQAADAENGQNAQGKGSGKSSDKQASSQPGSGIGRQDGNKDAKLAEQLAAMGKISEIIGKRSANVSGEVMMEVQSSQQQLKTAYSQQNARHMDTGGDISRDEVPVVFQEFVQQYFEQVRKQGDGPAKREILPSAGTQPHRPASSANPASPIVNP